MTTLFEIFSDIWLVWFFSQSEHDQAVAKLNKNLNEVESGLSDAEHNKPVYDDKDSVDLDTVIQQLEEQKVSDLLWRSIW